MIRSVSFRKCTDKNHAHAYHGEATTVQSAMTRLSSLSHACATLIQISAPPSPPTLLRLSHGIMERDHIGRLIQALDQPSLSILRTVELPILPALTLRDEPVALAMQEACEAREINMVI